MPAVLTTTVLFAFICSTFAVSQPNKQIKTIVPTCGPLNKVTSVIINGKGFHPTDQIRIGSSILSGFHVIFKSTEEMLFFVSGQLTAASKNCTVNVLSSDGKIKSNTKYFYVYDLPNYIEEIQPKIGWEGDLLTAKGHFMDCGAVKCRFGALQMTVDATFFSKALIKCKVPKLDNHAVTSVGFKQKNAFNNTKDELPPPPPDPDNAKRFTLSSDGQHFDSIPDTFVFTYRDPVRYVALWIYLACLSVAGSIVALACVGGCCWFGAEKCYNFWCKCIRRFKTRKGYSKV